MAADSPLADRVNSAHRSVDLPGPGFDAAFEVDGIPEAGIPEKADDHPAASAVMANDNEWVARRQLANARQYLGHRNMKGAVQPAYLWFYRVTRIENRVFPPRGGLNRDSIGNYGIILGQGAALPIYTRSEDRLEWERVKEESICDRSEYLRKTARTSAMGSTSHSRPRIRDLRGNDCASVSISGKTGLRSKIPDPGQTAFIADRSILHYLGADQGAERGKPSWRQPQRISPGGLFRRGGKEAP